MKKRLIVLSLMIVLILAVAIPALAAPAGFLVADDVASIDKKGYDSFVGKEYTSNNSRWDLGNGLQLVSDNKTKNAECWYLEADATVYDTVEVAYKISSKYYIATFEIAAAGKYYIGDAKGSNGVNMVKVDGAQTPPDDDIIVYFVDRAGSIQHQQVVKAGDNIDWFDYFFLSIWDGDYDVVKRTNGGEGFNKFWGFAYPYEIHTGDWMLFDYDAFTAGTKVKDCIGNKFVTIEEWAAGKPKAIVNQTVYIIPDIGYHCVLPYEFDVTVYHRDKDTGAYLVYPNVGETFNSRDEAYIEWLNNVKGFEFLNLYLAATRTNNPADMRTVEGYVCESVTMDDPNATNFKLTQKGAGKNITALVTPKSEGLDSPYVITFWYKETHECTIGLQYWINKANNYCRDYPEETWTASSWKRLQKSITAGEKYMDKITKNGTVCVCDINTLSKSVYKRTVSLQNSISKSLDKVDYRFTKDSPNYGSVVFARDEFSGVIESVKRWDIYKNEVERTKEWKAFVKAVTKSKTLVTRFDKAFAKSPTNQGYNKWDKQFIASYTAMWDTYRAWCAAREALAA